MQLTSISLSTKRKKQGDTMQLSKYITYTMCPRSAQPVSKCWDE